MTSPTESPFSDTPTVSSPGLRMRRPEPSTPSTPTPEATLPPVADPLAAEDGTHTRSSAEPVQAVKVNRGAVAQIIRGAVATAGLAIHKRFAADTPEERVQEIWVPTDADQAAIGNPIAQIIGRKTGVAEMNSDTADLIAAGIGFAAYLLRNLPKAVALAAARRERRAQQRQAAEAEALFTPRPQESR